MTYADTHNLRDKDLVTLNDFAAAVDGLTTDYDSVSVAATQSIASATPAVITGATISIAVEAGEYVRVTGYVLLSSGTAARYGSIRLYRDAVEIGIAQTIYLNEALSSGQEKNVAISAIDEPAAGTYDYEIHFSYTGTATTIYADNTYLMAEVIRENE